MPAAVPSGRRACQQNAARTFGGKMRTSQVVIVTLSAIVILSVTQVSSAMTPQARAGYTASIDSGATAYAGARADVEAKLAR